MSNHTHIRSMSLTSLLTAMATAGLVLSIGAVGVPIVDEGFESMPTHNDQGATVVSDNTTIELVSGGKVDVRSFGALSDVSVDVENGGTFGTDTLSSTPLSASFSMMTGTRIDNQGNSPGTNQGLGVGFGWSYADDTIVAYNDGNANVTVGLKKTNASELGDDPAPTMRLAYSNNTSNNGGTEFGTGDVELQGDHWYLLEGTIDFLGFDGSHSSFDVTASVYDLGTEPGESLPGTQLLTGSASFSFTGDWSSAQPIFFANSARGFTHVDNLFAEALVIPEPASFMLFAVVCAAFAKRPRRV